MANFNEVMKALWDVEHNNNDNLVLHKNVGEDDYTFYGIYPYTKLKSYKLIRNRLKRSGMPTNGRTLRRISKSVANNKIVYQEVLHFYYKHFWAKLDLDRVKSTVIATSIMVFAINIGLSRYRRKYIVKSIQEILGVKIDGIIGSKTIQALNEVDEDYFRESFNKYEVSFYELLVKKNQRLKHNLVGWIKRARKY